MTGNVEMYVLSGVTNKGLAAWSWLIILMSRRNNISSYLFLFFIILDGTSALST